MWCGGGRSIYCVLAADVYGIEICTESYGCYLLMTKMNTCERSGTLNTEPLLKGMGMYA